MDSINSFKYTLYAGLSPIIEVTGANIAPLEVTFVKVILRIGFVNQVVI